MRQLKEFGASLKLTAVEYVSHCSLGWMHNRCRMIVAMYLTKDLMLDWRLGERVSVS